MLILSMSLLGIFILNAILFDRDIDDDDHHDGGMLIPAHNQI